MKRMWPWLVLGVVLGGCFASWLFNRVPNTTQGEPSPGEAPPGMVWIPGGEFVMGSDADGAKEDEQPTHRVKVSGFFMDKTEVTNAEFKKFVEATKFVTLAEKMPDLEEIRKSLPPGSPLPLQQELKAGSMVFQKTKENVKLLEHHSWMQWWKWEVGASWKQPFGPNSKSNDNEPVVHVCWNDAKAYCDWAGKQLPTEAQWEFAARGGLARKKYVWGDEAFNRGAAQCNIWQGQFPVEDQGLDKYQGVAPVGSFGANGYGLFDMSGNVWEFCQDWYRPDSYKLRVKLGFIDKDPTGPGTSYNDCPGEENIPKKVIRGGSFLCNDAYCTGYRPSARMQTSLDTAQNHLGFRAVMTEEQYKAWKGTK